MSVNSNVKGVRFLIYLAGWTNEVIWNTSSIDNITDQKFLAIVSC